MKSILKLTTGLALALGLAAGTARATAFEFSYTFDNESIVSGSFTGDLNGNFVDNIANLLVKLDTGDLASFTAFGSDFASPAIVSFDATLNDFYFVGDDPGQFAVFSMLLATGSVDATFPNDSNGHALDATRWLLTAQASPNVPDQGATLALLALSLGTLAWLQGRFRSATT